MPTPPTPRTAAGREGLAALLARPQRAVVVLDFDGTLAPLVADPDTARAHPDTARTLSRLAPHLLAVAVLTGRPAEAAVRHSGLGDADGLDRLTVLGAYGAERWDAASRTVRAPEPPAGVAAVREELPALLEQLAAPAGTLTEDKGRALAVHTRRTADPDAALDLLRAPLHELAERHALTVEPGRMVLELRPPGVDKGAALDAYVREVGAAGVLYAGDDLGDLAAFAAVERLRGEGVPGLLVCSGGGGGADDAAVPELAARADLSVDGPAGLLSLLDGFAEAVEANAW